MRIFKGIEELEAAAGQNLGVSEWQDVTQERIDAFAKDTGDLNWIHVDVGRAAAESPTGGTIAHGLYTLSLGPKLQFELFGCEGVGVAMNYGYNRVRFPAPVPVGSRIRMHLELATARAVGSGAELTLVQTFECEGTEKPVCVAEAVLRYIG